jgi:hypothetical protein
MPYYDVRTLSELQTNGRIRLVFNRSKKAEMSMRQFDLSGKSRELSLLVLKNAYCKAPTPFCKFISCYRGELTHAFNIFQYHPLEEE